MAEVILKNVCKVYDGNKPAVQDVSLEILDKEFVVLVGPSGCGKSTTLRMIAGLEEVTSGEIFIDGKLVNNISPKDRDIAMVFQNYALYPHMTVYENMAFGLKIRKFSKQDIKDRVAEAAKILELEPYLERKPKALSGGQRQRVAVGRAIVRKPKVFLFDEPLSNLDAKLRVQMRTEISRLHKSLDATMIYVTHDQTEAMTMGDRIVIMKDGVVNQVDTPLNLYNFPKNKFVGGFIGSPSMNFISATVNKSGTNLILAINEGIDFAIGNKYEKVLENYIGKKVWIGIRPEAIYGAPTGNSSSKYSKIKVILDVVEPMGNEIFLYFTLDSTQIIARIPSSDLPKQGSERELFIDTEQLHFFEYETEKKLL